MPRLAPWLILLAPLMLVSTLISADETEGDYLVRHRVEFTMADLSLSPAGPDGMVSVKLDGAALTGTPGHPALPVVTLRIALPAGMTANGVRLVESRNETLAGIHLIRPAGLPQVVGEGRRTPAPVPPDPSIYRSAEPWPATPVALSGQADLAGRSFAVVRVHPLVWNPTSGELTLHTSLVFELIGSGGYRCGDYLPAGISAAGRRGYEEQLQNLVVNPEDAAPRTAPAAPLLRGVGPGSYDHVIVTSTDWADDFQPLADWRTATGARSTIVTTEWIYTSGAYIGSAVQQLRAFVQDVHDTWGATRVLFGGDSDLIPCHVRSVTVPGYWTDDIPNDTYYGDFDGDFVCEVATGRASVRNTAQIATFVGKVLTYEQNPPNKDYLEMALFLGFDNTDGDGKGETEKELLRATHLPPTWVLNTEYDSEPGAHKTDMIGYLNQGHHLVNHHEHCNWYGIGAGAICHGDVLEVADANGLSNGNKQSIVFAIGCWPCDFSYDICIAEAFLRRFGGGAVAFLGNTRYGWGAPASDPVHYSVLQDFLFYESLFQLDMHNMGDMFSRLKNLAYDPDDPYNLNDYCFTQMHLLGDPGMQVWTATPTAVTDVGFPGEIATGGQTFTVTVDHGGPLDGFSVCLWKGDEVYGIATTDAAGQAELTIAPATEGTMLITVCREDTLPWQGSCLVTGGPLQTLSVGFSAVPDSGTVPFTSTLQVTLTNLTAENRRAAGQIDVLPAGGSPVTNWRAGWTNLAPLEVFTTGWNQSFPALGSLIGSNLFTLTGADTTPPPYNQPPYAPSGSSDTASFTLSCTAP